MNDCSWPGAYGRAAKPFATGAGDCFREQTSAPVGGICRPKDGYRPQAQSFALGLQFSGNRTCTTPERRCSRRREPVRVGTEFAFFASYCGC